MGRDWRAMTWLEYQITLAGWNANQSGEQPEGRDFSRLKRAMEAHTVH
jgi:hypothetical protein